MTHQLTHAKVCPTNSREHGVKEDNKATTKMETRFHTFFGSVPATFEEKTKVDFSFFALSASLFVTGGVLVGEPLTTPYATC